MFYSSSDRMFREGAGESERNVDVHGEHSHNRHGAANSEDSTGQWGERAVGEPVNFHTAMQEYEGLQRQLSHLSQSRSHTSRRSARSGAQKQGLKKTLTSERANQRQSQYSGPPVDDREVETPIEEDREPEKDEVDEGESDFQLSTFLRDGHFEKRVDGASAKKVGVVFKHLTVEGVGATTTTVKTLPSAVIGTFGPDLYKILSRFIPFLPQVGSRGTKRKLIDDFTGVLRDGQMMLVLGRPGSGCSTFLKSISNKRNGFAAVTGEVSYGGISAEEQLKHYRGEVIYNEEDDQHFASMTVEQTLDFALLNKTKKHHKGSIPIIINALLNMFGISHTRHTLVGDAFVRGISGGERKRVSIAETLATKSTVVAWDNSTRGLDASTALDYANSLRVMTDISGRTTLVTLYQAGEGIYELMDKVMVIDSGKMIYQGPANKAKAYFVGLGYFCPDRQTTADFLTAVTDPVERRFRHDFEGPIPKGPLELERAFRESESYQNVLKDVDDYEKYTQETGRRDAQQFKQSVQEQKSKTVTKRSPYTVSFLRQVLACTKREFELTIGDTTTLYTKAFIILSISLIVSSLFYGQSTGTSGAFSRGGTAFFSILFLGWLQLAELMKAVSGRPIIARHKDYAFYRPSAVVIARVLQDFPLLLIQVIPFGIVMYFLSGLFVTAGRFFIYLLFVYMTTICITSLYRMFAALSPTINDAVRFSGIGLNLLIIYTGYVIPKPQLLGNYIWFGWLYYINPIAYAFEAILANEFAGRTMQCDTENIVPRGAGYTNTAYQGCTLTGSTLGSLQVTGSAYIGTAFEYSRSHLWRNFGVLIAFTVLYILVTMAATEIFDFSGGGGGALEFKKTKAAKEKVKQATAPDDVEKGGVTGEHTPTSNSSSNTAAEQQALKNISGSESVFTWENVEYTVPYLGGERKLLNKVNGYAVPGSMIALMGASGAGKTTLLNTLAQRQKTGVVGGDMLVDGKKLGAEFQRGTGFCEQMDLHDGTATIREALEFSAILRQESHIPRADKIAYVDEIIDLLELGEFQDALIRALGVEQRKRVTIGVELAAKPSLLLFLDEPTSGLDSQSAFSIVRFLRKLANAGQAIVCTIHQPSSVLIQEFDMILALNPGGNTFYFGPVGENGGAVVKYFADRGVTCPPEKNVAEFILETAAKGGKREDGKKLNWNDEWLNSSEAQSVTKEISRLSDERGRVAAPEKGSEKEFASPTWLQIKELTKRTFRQHWRDPSYLYGKIFVSVIIGIFNGFTFYQLGNSIQDMQNRMFTAFLIIVIPPTIVNGVVPRFYQNLALWGAREHPSRIYGWIAFTTAQVVAEIPIAIVTALIYWCLWYWATGLPTDSSTSGYVFLMTMLFFFFQASWGQWICAFAPSFTVISNVLPFFFVVFSLFNGVIRPYAQINVFWRYWLYYAIPSTYWIGGVIAATLNGISVHCTADEAAYFNPPPGMSCSQYATDFVNGAGGYLTNPTEMSNCGYCPYTSGEQYMATLNIYPRDKWRYFGIFLAFVISNWALVYFFVYTVRVKGWSFGFGFIFGGLGKLVDVVFGLFKKKGKKGDAESGEN